MKTKKKQAITPGRRTPPKRLTAHSKQPFIEHAYELRRRLYFIGISVAVWSAAAYFVQQHLVNLLLRPAGHQSFIYTSPGGGIDFLFRICIYSGLVFSLPVIVYNSLRFIEPLISRASQQFVTWASVASGALAIVGMTFGYIYGLPAALHFLAHQFTTVQIRPLVTIQSYLGFVIVYMAGSAMIFQLPLILLCINRIKRLKPRKLLHYERWVILAAFVLSGLMNPTPNLISQLLIAGPFILMYQVGILLIAYLNRLRPADVLHSNDLELQAARNQRAAQLQPVVLLNRLTNAVTPAADDDAPQAEVKAVPVPDAEAPESPDVPAAPARKIPVFNLVTPPIKKPLTRAEVYANRGQRPTAVTMTPLPPRMPFVAAPSIDSQPEG